MTIFYATFLAEACKYSALYLPRQVVAAKARYHCLANDATVFSSTDEGTFVENQEYGYCANVANKCLRSSHTVRMFSKRGYIFII